MADALTGRCDLPLGASSGVDVGSVAVEVEGVVEGGLQGEVDGPGFGGGEFDSDTSHTPVIGSAGAECTRHRAADAVQDLRAMGLYVWPRDGGKVGFRPSTPYTLWLVKTLKQKIQEAFATCDLTWDKGVVFGSGYWFRENRLAGCYWCGRSTVERRNDGQAMHTACYVAKRERTYNHGTESTGATLLLPDGTPDPHPEQWKRSRPPGWGRGDGAGRKPPPAYRQR